jgi:hypothetical protein
MVWSPRSTIVLDTGVHDITPWKEVVPTSDGERKVSRLGRGGQMTVTRRREAVMRLLRGDDLEPVSRELGVNAATLAIQGV